MDGYKEHLRRLAIHDEAFVALLLGEEHAQVASALDTRTTALVRVAATIAVDAAPSSFQHAVALAFVAGATNDEIVATLEAVTPVTGTARAVMCAPEARAGARLRRRSRPRAPRALTGREFIPSV
jgi:alkylhydroperoxidase/carboxymuconolactone decarboxylase family protein YurZ